LWEQVLAPGIGFVLVATLGQVPVAGAVFLAWNGTLVYKYSASDFRYWGLRPNNLVLWTAIRWGCGTDFHTVDFGRTDMDNLGLRQFKNGWGTQERLLAYSTLPRRATTDRGNPARTMPGHLARGLTGGRGVLASMIRRSPSWVCRTIGELFYRYAA